MALQPLGATWMESLNLQQQKLLWLYSHSSRNSISKIIYNSRNCYGFIADIQRTRRKMTIYNSRNCYGFIAPRYARKVAGTSTIVEIVMALQPKKYQPDDEHIYNSRNCYGFIAAQASSNNILLSTIVEIVMALQPSNRKTETIISTIVEIVMALQPRVTLLKLANLQQQKLLWLYSHTNGLTQNFHGIYNSRNCYGFIASLRR